MAMTLVWVAVVTLELPHHAYPKRSSVTSPGEGSGFLKRLASSAGQCFAGTWEMGEGRSCSGRH